MSENPYHNEPGYEQVKKEREMFLFLNKIIILF